MNSATRRPRAGFAALVAAGILLSRLSGFVRQKIFSYYLGNSDAAGVFSAAYRIPNFLQNLFGEGVLSASFIPVYARLLAEGEEELAGRVAGIIASLLALTVAILVLIGVLLTPWLLIVIAPGFKGEARELTIVVVRILFPGIGLLVLSSWCLGILNSHRKFFVSYVAPVLMNQIVKNFTPVVIARGVVQLSAYLDNLLATLLGTAAASALSYAQLIALLPVSLFGMSVAAAELPQMSATLGSEEDIHAALRNRMTGGLRQIAFFVIPSVVAYIAIGHAIVAALYQGGRFKTDDTLYVWYILIGSTVGLLAATLGRLYSSAFYALRDTRTPLRFAILRVALTGILGYLFALPLRPLLIDALQFAGVPLPLIQGSTKSLGAIALTATAGVAGWLEFILLRRALGRRIGPVPLSRGYLMRLWTSAIIAGIAGAAFYAFVTPRLGQYLPRFLPYIRDGLIVCAIFGVIYFAMAWALGVPEARATVGRFLLRSSR